MRTTYKKIKHLDSNISKLSDEITAIKSGSPLFYKVGEKEKAIAGRQKLIENCNYKKAKLLRKLINQAGEALTTLTQSGNEHAG